MRGKATAALSPHRRLRITPACAGKSYGDRHGLHLYEDHPRVCGEKSKLGKVCFMSGGSPPRVRGKAFTGCCACCIGRITPACAGKSLLWIVLAPRCQDHPRVCGEKGHEGPADRKGLGSPPRVRGKVHQVCQLFAADRITPACAGKSPSTKRRG